MGERSITPDETVLWDAGFVNVNLTLVTTWVVMALLIGASWLITSRLRLGPEMSRWQNGVEVVVGFIRGQIHEISNQTNDRYLPFVGTLFIYILVANVLAVLPGYVPPTASLSTTIGLALCVFLAVPVYGITARGIGGYLRAYVQPNPFMLPFNIMSELSRTLALAVRLFGNVMSFTKIVAILLGIAPLLFPALLNALGLLTGVIQAYIFAVLATVYISAGSRSLNDPRGPRTQSAMNRASYPESKRKESTNGT